MERLRLRLITKVLTDVASYGTQANVIYLAMNESEGAMTKTVTIKGRVTEDLKARVDAIVAESG